MATNKKQIWSTDQLAKSVFFHQKVHQWELIEIAQQIAQIKGEILKWEKSTLEISEKGWNKVIHGGIKPVIVFAHPNVLTNLPRSTGYYRMLAMVSQKSMNHVGLSTIRYEEKQLPNFEMAELIAKHLNKIISKLVEADKIVDAREFDIWRGMAAGSQAQGSWQNIKGRKTEIILQTIINNRLNERGLILEDTGNKSRIVLMDNRTIIFADEPDIGFYKNDKIIIAIELKGGIDKAGVLERIGAAIKSLSRAKKENPDSVTILILPEVSMTPQSIIDLQTNQNIINYWFTVEDILENESKLNEIFMLLEI